MFRVLRSRVYLQALSLRLRQSATEARRQRDSPRILGIVGGHRGEPLRAHEVRQGCSVLERASAITQGILAVRFFQSTSFNVLCQQVYLHCGFENQVTSVSEPNRCEYEMRFTTPAACQEPKKPESGAHDEL